MLYLKHMDTSIFLAKLLGLLLMFVCAAVLKNAHNYERLVKEITNNLALLVFSGALLVAGGLSVVLSHNVWEANWRGLITLLGWLILLKGALRIFAPEKMMQWAQNMKPQTVRRSCMAFFLLGAYLAAVGFGWVS